MVTVYLLGYWFVIRGYISGTVRREMPRAGQGGNVFTGPNAPRTHPSRFLCRPRSTGAVDYITGH